MKLRPRFALIVACPLPLRWLLLPCRAAAAATHCLHVTAQSCFPKRCYKTECMPSHLLPIQPGRSVCRKEMRAVKEGRVLIVNGNHMFNR